MSDIINPKNYFAAIIAGLIILGIAIGSFVYSIFVNGEESVIKEIVVEESVHGDIPVASPEGLSVPSSPPSVPSPVSPPPGS